MIKKRNGEIDLFRFIFAILIVFHHFSQVFDYKLFSRGYIGVEFFFLVTGFLTAKKVAENDRIYSNAEIADNTWRFIIKKISVFYPYFLCAFFLQLGVKILIFDWSFIKAGSELVRSIPNLTLIFIGTVARSGLYVSGNWYLSAMIIALFILYPLLLKRYHLAVKIIYPLVSIDLLGYLYKTYSMVTVSWDQYSFVSISCGILRAIMEIALGMGLYEVTKVLNKLSVSRLIFTVIKYFSYFIVLWYSTNHTNRDFDVHALLWCTIGVALSFSDITYSLKESKITKYLGKISLPIYIFHTVFLRAYEKILGNIHLDFVFYIVLISSAIALSILFMYFTDLVKGRIKGK